MLHIVALEVSVCFFSMLFSTQKGAGFTFNSFKVRLPFVESCQSATDIDQDAMLDVGFKVFLWFTFTVEFGCWVWGNSAPTSPIRVGAHHMVPRSEVPKKSLGLRSSGLSVNWFKVIEVQPPRRGMVHNHGVPKDIALILG